MKNAHRVTDTEGLTNALNGALCKIEEQPTGNTNVLRFAARHAADACNLFERRLSALRDCELNELDPWDGTVTLYSTDVETIQRALDVINDRLTNYVTKDTAPEPEPTNARYDSCCAAASVPVILANLKRDKEPHR